MWGFDRVPTGPHYGPLAKLNPARAPRDLEVEGKAYWKHAIATFDLFKYPWAQTDLAQLHEAARFVDMAARARAELEAGLISEGAPSPAFKILKDCTAIRQAFERGLQLTRFTRKTRDVHPKAEVAPKPESQTAKVIELRAKRQR